jgi:hypothetical protein
MSSRFDDPSSMSEEQAYAEAKELFADYLKRFTTYRDAVERLEQNLSIMATAASIAASNSTSQKDFIQTDEGTKWHRAVVLMEHIHLCHRSWAGETEYAAVEYFPAHNRHEIWNQGGDAVDVVRTFAHEQRHALGIWTNDLTSQVREFLTENYPGRDLGRIAESFVSRFTQSVASQDARPTGQGYGQETQI